MNEYSFIFALDLRNRDQGKIDRIKSMAISLIARGGLDNFSIQKLAKKAGVSPATLYIYYAGKEEFIKSLAEEELKKMTELTLKDFDPDMSFAEGMRIQWRNRLSYRIKYPDSVAFWDLISQLPIGKKIKEENSEFKNLMRSFVKNAVDKKELRKLTPEIFWSLAFAPLYKLIEFHNIGKGLTGNTFKISDEMMNETLEIVLESLKPTDEQ